MTNVDANVSATVDLIESVSDSKSSLGQHETLNDFLQGATWSIEKVAAWLETTNIIAHDELTQRAVDATKLLIADQARQSAAMLRSQK
jgi:hypothetical protein